MDTETQRAIKTIQRSGQAKAVAVQLLDGLAGEDVMHIFARRWLQVPAEHIARALLQVMPGGPISHPRHEALHWAQELVGALEEAEADPLRLMHYEHDGAIACGAPVCNSLRDTGRPHLVTCPDCAATLEEPGDAINGGFPSVAGLARTAQPDPGPPTAFLPTTILPCCGRRAGWCICDV